MRLVRGDQSAKALAKEEALKSSVAGSKAWKPLKIPKFYFGETTAINTARADSISAP